MYEMLQEEDLLEFLKSERIYNHNIGHRRTFLRSRGFTLGGPWFSSRLGPASSRIHFPSSSDQISAKQWLLTISTRAG